MILRKPYAFLIKYFRVVHLILTILISFLLYSTNSVLGFFDKYVKESTYNIIDDISNMYIPNYLYILIILVIVLCITIILLLRSKEKPTKYYTFTSVMYGLLMIVFILSKTQLSSIESNNINVILLRISRDSLLITYILQIPILVVSILRTIGFDIKKFNFKKDVMELSSDEKDREEFELDVEVDTEDVKTKIRKRTRNLKYFYKENKEIILLILAFVLLFGTFSLYKISSENKIYMENSTMSSYVYNIKLINSYQLESDYRGNDITNDGSVYIALKLSFQNKTDKNHTIDFKNMRIVCDDYYFYPTDKYYDYFIDIGKGYSGQAIKSMETGVYVFVFKIDNKYVKNNKTFEYIKSSKLVDNELVEETLKVKLNLKSFGKTTFIKSSTIGEKMIFNNNILNNTSLVINSYDIERQFLYTHKSCVADVCKDVSDYILPLTTTKYDASILKLDVELDLSKDLHNSNIDSNFVTYFGKIRYVIKGVEYAQKAIMNNLTPTGVTNTIYVEVNNDITDATSIYIDFYIRNLKYTYILRDK